MQDLIDRTVSALSGGIPTEAIKDMLTDQGMSDYDAWLTYKAAELIVKSREKDHAESTFVDAPTLV